MQSTDSCEMALTNNDVEKVLRKKYVKFGIDDRQHLLGFSHKVQIIFTWNHHIAAVFALDPIVPTCPFAIPTFLGNTLFCLASLQQSPASA